MRSPFHLERPGEVPPAPRATARAVVPLVLGGERLDDAARLELIAPARRAVVFREVEEVVVRVVGHPATQFEVHLLEEHHILLVVGDHLAPRHRISGHAVEPQLKPLVMLNLAPEAEVPAELVKRVTPEEEVPLCDLLRVDHFVRRRGPHPMRDETRVGFADIEAPRVVGDDDIGLVEEFPELSNKRSVIEFVLRKRREIGELVYVDGLFILPLVREAQNVPVLLELDNILFPLSPAVPQIRSCLQIYEQGFDGTPPSKLKRTTRSNTG